MSTLPGTVGRRRIYLMRHGHVDYFAPKVVESRATHEVYLTGRGRVEASAAGRAFAEVPLDRVVCSGMPRARETAEIVLSHLAAPPELEADSGLAEIRGGWPSVTTREELIATMSFHVARAAETGATMLEGGEAFAAAQDRSVAVIRRLLSEPGWKRCLVVAHEIINRLVLSWAAGAGLSAAAAFEQDTGSINTIDFDMVPAENGGPGPEIARVLIKAVNLTPYDYLKHGMNLSSLEAIFTRSDDTHEEPGSAR